jgi:4-amino-4-deoxy-L-arabinose transferase-like glycosyltransferase
VAAKRFGAMVGILAAATMAAHPQLVQSAHYALTDTPLTLLVALTLLLSLRAAESGSVRAFTLAGIAVGLTTGSKYNGALVGLMPLMALAGTTPPSRWPALVAAVGGGALVSFLAVAPYTLIDWRGFVDGMADLSGYYTRETSILANADTYRKHLQSWFGVPGVSRYLTWPAAVVTLAGLVTIALQARDRAQRGRALVIIVFPVVYFWVISSQSLGFGRYAMPLVPVVALAFALGMTRVREWATRWPRTAAPVFVGLLLLFVPPAWTTVKFNVDRTRADTRELAAAWMERSVRPDEAMVVEARRHRFELPERRFKARQVNRLIEESVEHYRAQGAVYLVCVQWPGEFSPEHAAAYNALFRSTELVQAFTPTPNHATDDPTIRILRVPR